MAILGSKLDLERCPYCRVHRPGLTIVWHGETKNYLGQGARLWAAYTCAHCGSVVIAVAERLNAVATEVYPTQAEVSDSIPDPARTYLSQAQNTLHASAGAVMLAASSVDAMLKAKRYTEGTLYSRINQAAADHLITPDMAAWAHEVRLDANDQRHADSGSALPTEDDARRALDFVQALGTLLFVLPERIRRGRGESASR